MALQLTDSCQSIRTVAVSRRVVGRILRAFCLLMIGIILVGCGRRFTGQELNHYEGGSGGEFSSLSGEVRLSKSKAGVVEQRNNPDDAGVLATALADFAHRDDIWVPYVGGADRVIVVNIQSVGPSIYVGDTQISSELRSEKWLVPKGTLKDLQLRNVEVTSLQNISLGACCVLEDLEHFPRDTLFPRGQDLWGAVLEKYPEAKAYVRLWLPGYSADGMQAVVRFFFGPTPHGATATYLLVKEGGRWGVKERMVKYYL